MRAYLRIDPELGDRKTAYPDGALATFVMTLCAAEQQPHRGRFKNMPILRAFLGRRARWVTFLLEHNDLILEADGSIRVVGWDEWQEGDWKVGERVQRIRNGRQARKLTAQVTQQTVTPAVNTPSERLAVGGKHLAVGVPALTKDGGKAPDDDGPTIESRGWRGDEEPIGAVLQRFQPPVAR